MYLDSSLQTIGPKIPSEKLILNYWRKKIFLKTNNLYDALILLHNFNVVIWQLAYIALFLRNFISRKAGYFPPILKLFLLLFSDTHG